MKTARALMLAASFTAIAATAAFADITGFIGANTTPKNRHAQGFAVGAGVLVLGFEFEYASNPEDPEAQAPALHTGSGNLLIQTPFAIAGFQPYFTTGLGIYRETLGRRQDTGVGFNTGGGVKISLIGPIRLRFDYRVLKLGDEALESTVQRIYAGLNLKF
jgi:hypothetical protein